MLATLEPDSIRKQLTEMTGTDIIEFVSQLDPSEQVTTNTGRPAANWRDGSEFRDWSKSAFQRLDNPAW